MNLQKACPISHSTNMTFQLTSDTSLMMPLGAHVFWQLAKVTHGRSLCDKYKEHNKMVEGLSAWLDKIEQDRLAGRESVFL